VNKIRNIHRIIHWVKEKVTKVDPEVHTIRESIAPAVVTLGNYSQES